MPKESIVKYYIKDKELFNWINKDASNIMGKGEMSNKNNSIVEGTIYVKYKQYIINKGLEDSVFD